MMNRIIPVIHRPQLDAGVWETDYAPDILNLEMLERKAVIAAVQQSPSLAHAAARLGIGRSTLYRKMREYGITGGGV